MSDQKFWTSAPFVSYDGPDNDGHRAEVRVVKGFAPVVAIDTKGSASKISFSREPDDPESMKVSGWIPSEGEEKVLELARKSMDNQSPVYFRVETVRRDKNKKTKESISRQTPIFVLTGESEEGSTKTQQAEMTKVGNNCFKGIGAIGKSEDELIIPKTAKTNPLEDRDPRKDHGTSANDYTLEQLRRMNGGDIQGSSAAVFEKRFSYNNSPYKTYNNDGSLNIGAVSVGVPFFIYSFLADKKKEAALESDDSRLMEAASVLLKAANGLQVKMYRGKLDEPDLSDCSHNRARGLIFEAINHNYPLTDEVLESSESIHEWVKGVYLHAGRMWQWTIKEALSIIESNDGQDEGPEGSENLDSDDE